MPQKKLRKRHHEESKASICHKHQAPQNLKIALITASSSRYRDHSIKDDSGMKALDLCEKEGHHCSLEVVDDDKNMIRIHLLEALFKNGADVAILLGGTGLSPRDVTIEAVSPLLDKELEGYGELFRRLSYDEIGSPALMSRAIAGTIANKPVFCLPGSPQAAELGVSLLLRELPHAVFIATSRP